jgi:hypothetical protein
MITIIFRKTFSFSKKDLLWLMKSHKENPRQLPECRRFFSCYFHSSSPSLWGRVATTRGDTFAQTHQWEREPHNRKALFLYTSRSHSKGYLARCHTDVSFVFLSWGRRVACWQMFFLFPPFNEFQNPKTAFWPQLPTNELQRPRLIKKHFPNSFLVLSPELSPGRWQMVHHPLPKRKLFISCWLDTHLSFLFCL